MKQSFLAVLALIISAQVLANAADYVASKAALREQLAAEVLASVERQGDLAKTSLPVIEEFSKLVESLPSKEGKSVGELMNSQQADKFGQLSQKMKFFNAKELFISRRERDIWVVKDLVEKILGDYEESPVRYSERRDQKQKEFLDKTASYLGSAAYKNAKQFQEIEFINDGIDAAILDLTKAVGETMESRGEALRRFQTAYGSSRGTKFEVSSLSPDEKRDYESRLKPVRVALEAYTRLCGLRVLYTLCTLDNKYGTEEINNSAGEISAVGTKMNQLLGKSSEEVQNVIRVVWIINEKIPCDKVK